ncbi:hypothetical protein CLHUN_15500 [Ruminiclostridium hungatei]|uniref:Uncharacterized protein n=1 Tax=Ruminiclostridium hungatei TaxID=48256 RepID=A0A1V4SMT5_RUMHU|nr:hypothetical protein [Ruminiclostridium hungatei]OPX44557.1 hypothetical protein CLHUN_15500 [Ruminiclostridium hungatei]
MKKRVISALLLAVMLTVILVGSASAASGVVITSPQSGQTFSKTDSITFSWSNGIYAPKFLVTIVNTTKNDYYYNSMPMIKRSFTIGGGVFAAGTYRFSVVGVDDSGNIISFHSISFKVV